MAGSGKETRTEKALARFRQGLARRGLRRSLPREQVARVFLGAARHVTVAQLTAQVRRRRPEVGLATVYRALKLLAACGLCREVRLEDGTARYEPVHARAHHDHLICVACNRLVEVVDARIERLQEALCRRHGFAVEHHRLEIFGLCRSCRAARRRGPATSKGKGMS